MTITTRNIIIAGFVALMATLAVFFIEQPTHAADNGLHATMATSSPEVVGPQANMKLFSADTTCLSRVITTVGQPIMISFDSLSSTSLSGVVGHLQAASTTVGYDSSLFGCGLWTAFGFVASTSVTLSEFQ